MCDCEERFISLKKILLDFFEIIWSLACETDKYHLYNVEHGVYKVKKLKSDLYNEIDYYDLRVKIKSL